MASGRRLRRTSSTRLEEVLRDFLVDGELAGVDDAHVQPGANGVVKERGVHGLADRVVAAEREGDIADAAAESARRGGRP